MPAIPVRVLSLVAVVLAARCAICGQITVLRETPLVRAVRDCRMSVVNIHTEKSEPDQRDKRFFAQKEQRVIGMGTGIVVDERGYIVTNFHVIHDVEQIIVTLAEGQTLTAQPVSFDRDHDLALIRIHAGKPLSVISIGTSCDLMLAEQVFAVGNAFGYEHTVTAGIISALSRNVEVDETQAYDNLIQTDTSINPGNSGGPLLNLEGQVIGINVAIRAGAQRIGFAIPIDDARRTIARLLSTERINHVTHGMIGKDVNRPTEQKLVVEDVVIGSPAYECGIQPGDVILRVRDISISDNADWERALLDMPVGRPLDITVEREGESVPLKFKVGVGSAVNGAVPGRQASAPKQLPPNSEEKQKPPDSGTDTAWRMFGLRLVPLSTQELLQIPNKYNGGMKVMFVRAGGIAARHGIRNGDILLGLDGYETLGERNLAFILNEDRIRTMRSIPFRIIRNGSGALDGSMNVKATPTVRRTSRTGSRNSAR